MSEAIKPVRVTVAGGGIAGMSAALRLAQRGYAVTLIEAKPWLGGNMASHQDVSPVRKDGQEILVPEGPYHDVYPHMFSNFYVNFWDIVEKELGLKRTLSPDSDFDARDGIMTLTQTGGWRELKNAATLDPRLLWADMTGGMSRVSPADMYLYLYSLLDLIVQRFETRGLIGLSLNGYIRSRPTATEEVAKLHDAIVMFIWSIHSAGTSAASYKSFYRHAFGNVQPLLWLLKGSLAEKIVLPLRKRLVELGCTVMENTALTQVEVEKGRVSRIELHRAEYDWNRHKVKVTADAVAAPAFDHLVLAVSPGYLGKLATEGKDPTRRLSAVLPKLAHAGKRLPAEPIAVLDVYFKRKLSGVPPENIMVTDSDCYFSVIDISQLWPALKKEGITALTLAASDYWALPSDNDDENAFHMIRELWRYIGGFNPGTRWEDPDADIDWGRTHFHSNKDDIIFVNQVGSWDYRPETHFREVENLFFAGDFCRNHVDMATVEAAVTSGINAAAAVQAASPMGERIVTRPSPEIPHAMLGALKLMLAPAAYAAKAWVLTREIADKATDGVRFKDLPHDLTALATLPAAYVGDVVETMGSMVAGLGTDWRKMQREVAPASAPKAS